MTIRSGTLASISLGSLVLASLIMFVVYPWANTTSDPDRIQAPAWILMLFLIMMAVVFGLTTVVFAIVSKTARL
jgi:hypothetical protein